MMRRVEEKGLTIKIADKMGPLAYLSLRQAYADLVACKGKDVDQKREAMRVAIVEFCAHYTEQVRDEFIAYHEALDERQKSEGGV